MINIEIINLSINNIKYIITIYIFLFSIFEKIKGFKFSYFLIIYAISFNIIK